MPQFHLALHGPARLDTAGRTVRLQRKGLALLYILALEGPTRRERAADLLWGHSQALRNLRVELHALRRAFEEHGAKVFADTEDPLRLPEEVSLDRTDHPGDLLEGLDDLSHEFQSWLEAVRDGGGGSLRQEPAFGSLAVELAESIRLPFLLILEGMPMSGRRQLALALAQRLDLPFLTTTSGKGRGLRFISADETPYSRSLVDTIVSDTRSLWVLERSAFGEDPPLLLALREAFPAQRSRYLKMPPLSWRDARRLRLHGLPLEEAARVYLASGGMVGYLDELLELRAIKPFTGQVPVPQRVRASFGLEALRLSEEARRALERLAAFESNLSEELIDSLGISQHLPELERSGWLRFDGQWSFSSEAVRRLLWQGLSPGQRSQYAGEYRRLLKPAEALAGPSEPRSEWEHLPLLKLPIGSGATSLAPEDWGAGLDWADGQLWWSSDGRSESVGRAEFKLPRGAQLLRLSGIVMSHSDRISAGVSPLLRIEPRGGDVRSAAIVSGSRRVPNGRDTLVIQANGEVDLWFLLPPGQSLSLRFGTQAGLAALTPEFAALGDENSPGVRSVVAYDLTADPLPASPRVPDLVPTRRLAIREAVVTGGEGSVEQNRQS